MNRGARFANRSARGARGATRSAEANLHATELLDEAGLLANDRGARSASGFANSFARFDVADRFARSDGIADRSARLANRGARSAFNGANRLAAREFRGEAALDGANGLDDGRFQSEARTNARNASGFADRGARSANRFARGDGFANRSARSASGGRFFSVLSENVRGSESEDDRKKDTSLHL